jgi:tetratricopeptide (TPR) repeat protein
MNNRLTRKDIRDLAKAIEAATSNRSKKPPTNLEFFYSRIQLTFKYVGIPSLIIASILPAYNLMQSVIEYSNRTYVQEVQSRYVSELLSKGEIDRAHFIMTELPTPDRFDVVAHYNKARILAKKAIKQGQQYEQAQDIIGLLLKMEANRPFLFPKIGPEGQLFGLKLDLAELHTQRGDYGPAMAQLKELRRSLPEGPKDLARAQIGLRQGHILVLTSKQKEARAELEPLIPVFQQHQAMPELGESNFLLAKSYQFEYDHEAAFRHYGNARQIFEKLADHSSLTRTYNNLGMLYFDARDLDRARYYYELQAQLARKLRDNLGLGRALVNLSMIDRNQGQFERAIENASEAREAFQQQGNKLGVATSLHNLANTYVRSGDNNKALLLSKQALLVFTELADTRGMARSMGLLGQAYENLSNYEQAAFHIYAAMAMNKDVNYERTAEGSRDLTAHEAQIARLGKAIPSTRLAEIRSRVSKEVSETLRVVKVGAAVVKD